MIMSDREFWELIRRGLLMIVEAIERKNQIGKYEPKPIAKRST